MSPPRVAVIGLGAMGKNHARVYRDLGARLVAVCDVDEIAGKLAAQRYGCDYVKEYKALLSQADVDAVSIATPTELHHPVAMAALEAGKHVLVEKPICDTIARAKELVSIARKSGLTLAVGHVERHNPAVQAVKRLLERGEAGDVLSIAARRVNRRDETKRVKDVGVVLDLAIHDIDVIRYLAGGDPESVFAAVASSGAIPHEDRAHILLRFPRDVMAVVDVNWLTPRKVRKLSLTCSKAYLEVDYIHQTLEVSSSRLGSYAEENLYDVPLELNVQTHHIKAQEPLANELRDFLRAVESGTRPLASGEDGLAALVVARAALRSSEQQRPLRLSEAADS